jgi:hypothetical protein
MAADQFDKLTLAFAQLSNIGQSYDSYIARQDNQALYDALFGSSTRDLQHEKKRKQSPTAASGNNQDLNHHKKRHKGTTPRSSQRCRHRRGMDSDADELNTSLLACRMKDKLSFQVGSFQISWFLTWIIKNEINPWLTMGEILLTWVIIVTGTNDEDEEQKLLIDCGCVHSTRSCIVLYCFPFVSIFCVCQCNFLLGGQPVCR